jgi:hypothetical protein
MLAAGRSWLYAPFSALPGAGKEPGQRETPASFNRWLRNRDS